MGNTVGRIVPPHASSLGKAIAAFQPEDVRERLVRSYGIHRFTEHTVTDEVELKREFERVRSRGYSTDEEESVLEGCCFGVPILDAHGDAIAAISVSSPKMRMRDEQLQKRLVAALRRAAGSVARDVAASVASASGGLPVRRKPDATDVRHSGSSTTAYSRPPGWSMREALLKPPQLLDRQPGTSHEIEHLPLRGAHPLAPAPPRDRRCRRESPARR